MSRFTYEPGARMPWGHRHRVQEEVYVVVAGSGRAKLDDDVLELSAWDVLRVAPAVIRSFEAGADGLDVICIGGRKPAGGDTETIRRLLGLTVASRRRRRSARCPRAPRAAPCASGCRAS